MRIGLRYAAIMVFVFVLVLSATSIFFATEVYAGVCCDHVCAPGCTMGKGWLKYGECIYPPLQHPECFIECICS